MASSSSNSEPTQPSITSLLGDALLTKVGETISTENALKDAEIVCFYFSASWCPPCRKFTPSLEKFYNLIGKSEHVKIIFVSGDNDQKSFEEYFGHMSFYAIPYENNEVKRMLNRTFQVNGIPTLVVMDGTSGNFITKDGRSDVASNDEASAKQVVTKWKQMDAVPLSEANLGGSGCIIL